MRRIAALYVDIECGPYGLIEGVDAWGIHEDARRYTGPWPVVAHPPCGPWGKFWWRADPATRHCAIRAVEQVREHGGILEHPEGSRLWKFAGLPRPGQFHDGWGGWTLAVDQCDFGFGTQKRTWLYMVGINPRLVVLPAKRTPTHYMVTPVDGLACLPKEQRHLTPPQLAEWLVALARNVR